ncbi:MAG: class I SAM-dependent methyltransferase, partial [Patescibacteria group bacterium]
ASPETQRELRVAFWGAIGPHYRDFLKVAPFWMAQRQLAKTVVENLPETNTLNLLDLGSGTLDNSEMVLDIIGSAKSGQFGHINLIGLDVSSSMIAHAKPIAEDLRERFPHASVTLLQADLNKPAWQQDLKSVMHERGAKHFDAVFSNWVLPYFDPDTQLGVLSSLKSEFVNDEGIIVYSGLTVLPEGKTMRDVLSPYGQQQVKAAFRSMKFKNAFEIIKGLKTIEWFGDWTGAENGLFAQKPRTSDLLGRASEVGFVNVKVDDTQLLGASTIVAARNENGDIKLFQGPLAQAVSQEDFITPQEFMQLANDKGFALQ